MLDAPKSRACCRAAVPKWSRPRIFDDCGLKWTKRELSIDVSSQTLTSSEDDLRIELALQRLEDDLRLVLQRPRFVCAVSEVLHDGVTLHALFVASHKELHVLFPTACNQRRRSCGGRHRDNRLHYFAAR